MGLGAPVNSINMLNGVPASTSILSSAQGNSANGSYNQSPGFTALGSGHYEQSGLGWMHATPQQAQLAHTGPSLQHSAVPSSPGYTGLGSSPLSLFGTNDSPATPQTQVRPTRSSAASNVSPEWHLQTACAEVSRQSFSPHHHARAAALAARSMVNNHADAKKGIQLPAGFAANGLNLSQSEETARGADDSFLASATSASDNQGTHDAEQTWSIIDMGGLHLKTIGLEVFRYSFLTSLFINHNSLTALSPAIVNLRNLSVLDASSNKLVMIPPELGMLTGLKGLFLFDNCLTVLPPELGTLYQLEMLGIEGNPMQDNIMSVLQREGTHAVITYLRDSCPVPVPPPEREWINLDPDLPSMSEEQAANATFAILSYNVLCEKYATTHMYGYTPSWALAWEYRKEFILQEIMSYNADICCLQEVEMGQYEEYFAPKLEQNDYEGIFWPKSRARTMRDDERKHVDGCATFFNSRVFKLVDKQLIEFNQLALQRPDFKKTEDIFNRVMTKDNVATIAMLEHRVTGAKLVVANAHMHWDPQFRDVKLVQAAVLMEQLEQAGHRFAKIPSHVKPSETTPPKYTSGLQIPTVICGDFNSTPDSGVYEFLSKGSAPARHVDFMDHTYGSYTSDGLHHDYALRSSYSNVDELPFTNNTPGFCGVIDYVWYTANTLAASGLLGEVDPGYLSRVVGFPNAHFPSDHICLLTELRMKMPKNEHGR
ncbi:poly(A)-specific ribonuclease [Malassezia vespertilionis]|uniref:CCR4-Not complex 3'-5'-exoribonuclease subunit Ccr4 n=1 Tax=Malassezia vespertilionis TaxID=2020962 RepID=A0A2N1J9C5_9BASI|nr:poly(A)-specific ribonuclease [Malassezia vespertilionis]PKI83157.1 Ccr4p [Malassezia vespertilionis]WFD07888.1 poly(A)-specific ribonuclease [Malassezia vespertilionis]